MKAILKINTNMLFILIMLVLYLLFINTINSLSTRQVEKAETSSFVIAITRILHKVQSQTETHYTRSFIFFHVQESILIGAERAITQLLRRPTKSWKVSSFAAIGLLRGQILLSNLEVYHHDLIK